MKFNANNPYKPENSPMLHAGFESFVESLNDEDNQTNEPRFDTAAPYIEYFVEKHNSGIKFRQLTTKGGWVDGDTTELQRLAVLWKFAHDCWYFGLLSFTEYHNMVETVYQDTMPEEVAKVMPIIELFELWAWG
jgi:hypothetical protein